jgi:hypothetical protein
MTSDQIPLSRLQSGEMPAGNLRNLWIVLRLSFRFRHLHGHPPFCILQSAS